MELFLHILDDSKFKMKFLKTIVYYLYCLFITCGLWGVAMHVEARGQLVGDGSLSTMWDLGVELTLLSLVEGTFTCSTISLTPK